MKISRISPFVVAPAPEDDKSKKLDEVKIKVLPSETVSAGGKDHKDSGEVISAIEYLKRKKEQKKREKQLKQQKGLKTYSKIINEDAYELMKDNFKRKG